jgi:23S rRNA pseudouridine2605 synthase
MTDNNDDDKRGRPRGRSEGQRPRGRPPQRGASTGPQGPKRFGAKSFGKPKGDRAERGEPQAGRDRDERRGPGRKAAFGSREDSRSRGEFRERRDAPSGGGRDRADFRGRGDRAPRGEWGGPGAKRSVRESGRESYSERSPAPEREADVAAIPAAPPEPVEERIAKVIARAGVASRRDAEVMIEQGRVTLNGEVLRSPAVNVSPDAVITIDGEPLPLKERTRLWIFHKPRGVVTTARDPEGRQTVFDILPDDLPRVVSIGRLDINTEGLLLLTNDGGLAKVIAHPDTGWLRRYRVRAHGDVTQADLDRLRDGVTIDGMEYGPVEAWLDRVQGDNVWITMGLREGKNREVKRILEHLGLAVNRLIRLSFGPFQLGDLETGLVEEVKTRVLKDQLGEALAVQAGVDFESPVREPIAPFGTKPGASAGTEDRPHRRPAEHRAERRFDDRPKRRHFDERERPPRPRQGEDTRSFRGTGDERERRTSWRADEEENPRRTGRPPRRGADAKQDRATTGAKPRQRLGAVASPEGRRVIVERLVSSPKEDVRPPRPARSGAWRDEPRPSRGPRRAGGFEADSRARAPRRPAPAGEDRPRRGPPKPGGPRPGGRPGGKPDRRS